MKTPGITVKPIIVLDGAHEVNEVFFDNVKVPVENRVGEENKGWTYAKFLLVNERSGIAGVARSKKAIERLKEIARAETDRRQAADRDRRVRAQDRRARRSISPRSNTPNCARWPQEAKGQMAGPESSILKIKGTEIQQRITELTRRGDRLLRLSRRPRLRRQRISVGPGLCASAQPGHYFNMRKASIYGGSNEIQRNIIAKAVLGL